MNFRDFQAVLQRKNTILLFYDPGAKHYQTLLDSDIEFVDNQHTTFGNNHLLGIPSSPVFSSFSAVSSPQQSQLMSSLHVPSLYQQQLEIESIRSLESEWKTIKRILSMAKAKHMYQNQVKSISGIKCFTTWIRKSGQMIVPSFINVAEIQCTLSIAKFFYDNRIKIEKSQLGKKPRQWRAEYNAKQPANQQIPSFLEMRSSSIKGWNVPDDYFSQILIS